MTGGNNRGDIGYPPASAQTSDPIATLAASYMHVTGKDIANLDLEGQIDLAHDIRSMAASLLRQDEHKGLRGALKRLIGR